MYPSVKLSQEYLASWFWCGLHFNQLLLCSASLKPESTSEAPLTVWTVEAHCPKKQPIYREKLLQVVNLNDKMLLICFLGTKPADVPTKCEAFLDGIFEPAGEAELLVDLLWKRVLSCLCSPCQCKTQLAVKTSCAFVAVLSVRMLGTCSTCRAVKFGKENMQVLLQ